MSVFTSGNWLMTAKRRAKEGILQAVGAHQATEDLEFDQRLKNFYAHVNELNKIKEAMDLWIESFDTFCTASLILGESFKNFFAQSPFKNGEETSPTISAYANVSAAFDKVMLDINQTVQPAIRETFVNRCLKPTISILSLVPAINEQVQERKTIMLDFDSYKAKIQKEHAAGRDSAHPNVVKKAIKLDDSAKKLYAIQQSIVSSIEEYEAARPIMLGAEFASFIACYYQQSYYASDLTSKLLPIVPQSSSSLNMMDLYIMQHNKQKHAMNVASDSSSGVTTRVLSGGYVPPNTSFMSTQFLCELKSRNACSVVEPILTRTEYLGGSYGGYNTGGQYLRPTSTTEDDDDIREATAQLVSPNSSNQPGSAHPFSPSSSSSQVRSAAVAVAAPTVGGAGGVGSSSSISGGGLPTAGAAGSHLSVNTPVVDAVVIEGVCTETTTPASVVSNGHDGGGGSRDSTSSGSPRDESAAATSAGKRPPPPPPKPKHNPNSPHTPDAIEHPQVDVVVSEVAVAITTTTTTEGSGGFLTALDATAIDDSTLNDNGDAGFFTPSVGPRSFSVSNAILPAAAATSIEGDFSNTPIPLGGIASGAAGGVSEVSESDSSHPALTGVGPPTKPPRRASVAVSAAVAALTNPFDEE